MKKHSINNRNIQEQNNESTWVASNTVYNISTSKDLNKFFRICDDRFSGKNRFADHGYLVAILGSVDFLNQINDYFAKNKLNIEKLKASRIYIKLNDNIPSNEMDRIKVIKTDDFHFVNEKLNLLSKAIDIRLKPELTKLLQTTYDEAGMQTNLENVNSAILNVELTWYYKYLLESNIDLVTKTYYDYSDFELYSKDVIEKFPVKNCQLATESKFAKQFSKHSLSKKVDKQFIIDYLFGNPEINTYEEALELAYLFKDFYENGNISKINKKFRKFLFTKSHDLLSFLLNIYGEELTHFDRKFGSILRDQVNGCNTLFREAWSSNSKINTYLESLVSSDEMKNVYATDNIIKEIKKIDFFLNNLHSILNKFNYQSIEPSIKNEINEWILRLINMASEMLTYLTTYRIFRVKNRSNKISFNTKEGTWLNKISTLEAHEFVDFPKQINSWFKDIFFKIVSIKPTERDKLFGAYGLAYFYNVVPIAYKAYSDLLNVLKVYLINLEILLKNNAELVQKVNLDINSKDIINSFFENYLRTTEKMKISFINVLENIDLIGTAGSVTKREELLKYKDVVDQNLNISNEYISIDIVKKTINAKAKDLSKDVLNKIIKLIHEIEMIVKYVKNASIGMSIAINFMIESSELIKKERKAKSLIKNDTLFNILSYLDVIETKPEIIVPYKVNISTINQSNWFESQRIFSGESRKTIANVMNNIYDEYLNINAIFDEPQKEINIENSRSTFEKLWKAYICEQGIIRELFRLSRKTEDLANEIYLKLAFTKAKLELFDNNLTFSEEKNSLLDEVQNQKLWLLKIYIAQKTIYTSLIQHKKASVLLTNKLEKLFINSRYTIDTLALFVSDWIKNKEKNLKELLNLESITDNIKVKFISESLYNFYDFVDMKRIQNYKFYNEWMPKSIFAKFTDRDLISELVDLVPIINYERKDDAIEFAEKFVSPYDEVQREQQANITKKEFNSIINNYEETIEDLRRRLRELNEIYGFANEEENNANNIEEIDLNSIEYVVVNEIPFTDEELYLLPDPKPEIIVEDIVEKVSEETTLFDETFEDDSLLRIIEIDENGEEIEFVQDARFKDEKLNIIYLDMINDDNINWEKVSIANDDWYNTVVLEDSHVSEEFSEIVDADNCIEEIEQKFEPVIIDFDYVENKTQQIKENNNENIERIFADETQLSDDELVNVEIIEQPSNDEIEYIYADDTQLSDSELLIPEIVEVSESENNEVQVQEEFIVVDETAPYADSIKEINENYEIKKEVLIDFSAIENVIEEETNIEIVEPSIEEEFADLSIYNKETITNEVVKETKKFSTLFDSLNNVYPLSNSIKVLELNDPESTNKELDWSELDANSHVILHEEPVYVKSFKISY